MEVINGKITGYDERAGVLYVEAPYTNYNRMALRKYSEVEIGLADGRKITPEQRKKAHALIGEIAEWCGDLPDYVKRLMKMEFVVNRLEGLEKNIFSLADCDVTTAREFITFLIDFILEHEIPVKVPLVSLCEDIEKYVYSCLMHKRCAVSGRKPVDLHHVDKIGMGRNRDTIFQLGMRVLPLHRIYHTEAESTPRDTFLEKYHLVGIPITVEIGKVYGLTKKNLGVI